MIEIAKNTCIPASEFAFKTSRSGGPGGQNVNKLNTRVTLLFDVAGSPSLSAEQKQRILGRLSTRIDRSGVLRVASQKHRSQQANRRATVERLQQLLQDALKRRAPRKKTQIPAAERERRLKDKRQRSLRKNSRAKRDWQGEWGQ